MTESRFVSQHFFVFRVSLFSSTCVTLVVFLYKMYLFRMFPLLSILSPVPLHIHIFARIFLQFSPKRFSGTIFLFCSAFSQALHPLGRWSAADLSPLTTDPSIPHSISINPSLSSNPTALFSLAICRIYYQYLSIYLCAYQQIYLSIYLSILGF